jgi:hypothetical protein
MIDSLDDERLPFSISDEDLIDFNVWMKEHDRKAREDMLTALDKKCYDSIPDQHDYGRTGESLAYKQVRLWIMDIKKSLREAGEQ